MVLIYKGIGDYHGIGLVEVVWKLVAVILNLCFTASITFHGVLHGFQAVSGTGTNSIQAKLLQKFMGMREEILYVIFLKLYKAYVALERDRRQEILEGYGVGTWDHHIFLK